MKTEVKINLELLKSEIADYLRSQIDIIVIYIYGSITSERFNQESDIDIAVITREKIEPLQLYELSSGLALITKRDIHLVDFMSVSDILKIEILKNKNIIYCSDENKRLFIEMNALTSYQKLNEEREIVIKTKYGEAAWTSL